MRGLCGIAMEVAKGGFLDLRFYMVLMPETRLFKVQGMGNGQLRPERRLSRVEIGSARQIQFSKHWHAREIWEISTSIRSHGFLSFSGVFFYLAHFVIIWCGDGCSTVCDVA